MTVAGTEGKPTEQESEVNKIDKNRELVVTWSGLQPVLAQFRGKALRSPIKNIICNVLD